MSTHLLIAAAYLEGLPQGRKLVLMAIADSGDEHTLESAPGLPKMRAWSGLAKSATLDNVAELEAAGLITRISPGRLGRRAVYRVFPAGVPAIPHPSEVAARYDTPPVDNPSAEGPADRTLGSGEAPTRVRPAGPLHAYPSVSSAPRRPEPVETRRTAPPAPGFPGSRASHEDAQGIARRAKGAADQPCPFHAGEIVPCRRCANGASKVAPETRAGGLRAMRAAAAAAKLKSTTDTDTDTEETRSA